MVSRFSSALAIAALACLTLVPGAAAVGIEEQRAITAAESSAAARTATTSMIAPTATCPDQDSLAAPAVVQEQAMLCMTNFARANTGLPPLSPVEELDRSAHEKAADVLRCDDFSHFACGREFTYWIRAEGYIGEACWHAGENLAWGAGEHGSVRAIFRAWMSSPTHRQNILGDYGEAGIGLRTGKLQGHSGTAVWATHFGSRCAI